MSETFDALFRQGIERLHYDVEAKGEAKSKLHVVIWPTFSGLSDFEKSVAEKLSSWGISATAIDLYGQGKNPIDLESASSTMMSLISDPTSLHGLQKELTASACLNHSEKQIVHIGFCLGGRLALEAGLHLPASSAAVSFHGLMSFYRADSADKANTDVKILVLNGFQDPLVPSEAALEAKQYWNSLAIDWQFVDLGNTMHSFMRPGSNAPERGNLYNPVSEARGYAYMKSFLEELAS